MKALTAEVLGDLADCDECSGVTKAVARKRISKYATVQYRKCPECGATKVINTMEMRMKQESIPTDFRIEKRSCMVLLGKAIRAGWPMSTETRESVVQQLSDILKMKDKPRWVLRATELILLMDKQNAARVI